MTWFNLTIALIMVQVILSTLAMVMLYKARWNGYSPIGLPVEQYQDAFGAWFNFLFGYIGSMMIILLILFAIIGAVLMIWFEVFAVTLLVVPALGGAVFLIAIITTHLIWGNWGGGSFSYTSESKEAVAQLLPVVIYPIATYVLAIAGCAIGW